MLTVTTEYQISLITDNIVEVIDSLSDIIGAEIKVPPSLFGRFYLSILTLTEEDVVYIKLRFPEILIQPFVN